MGNPSIETRRKSDRMPPPFSRFVSFTRLGLRPGDVVLHASLQMRRIHYVTQSGVRGGTNGEGKELVGHSES